MELLSLKAFSQIVGGTFVGDVDQELQVANVATHSEQLRNRSVFFALRGTRDGHDFVESAFRNGAVAAVVADRLPGNPAWNDRPLILVDDPLRALQRLAAWWRSKLHAQIVAVVGNNGKTTTKNALVHFIGSGFAVYGSPGSYNSQLGVALSILDCPPECDLAVVELAVSKPGEMEHLEAMLRPDRVVLTNLGQRWQAQFASRAEQARELLFIATRVPRGGWVLLGRGDRDLEESADAELVCERFLSNQSGGLPRFSAPEHSTDGLTVTVAFPDGVSEAVCVRTVSEEVLADFELAVSAAWLLGIGSDGLMQAALDYVPTSTRMEIWRSPGGVTIIRDVATLDPIAIGSALRAIKRLRGPRARGVVVMADPFSSWDASAASVMAQVLTSEGASAVYGLDVASHRAVAQALLPVSTVTPMHIFQTLEEMRVHLLATLETGDVALVQSPRHRSIGDLSVGLIESMAPTRLYLDLSAIEDNVATFRRIVGPSVRLLGVVKALAYGTDSLNISSCLADAGVDFLGVSGADEGATLRRAGVNAPILVMLGTADELEKMARYRLVPLIYSAAMFDSVMRCDAWLRAPIPVHVEVDTGMHRTGFEVNEAMEVLSKLNARPNIRVEGLMTHLACADEPDQDAATDEQLSRFKLVTDFAARLGLTHVIRHAAATAATIRFPESHFDMVRIGLGLYGLHPSDATRKGLPLTPALGLVSRIVEIIDVPAGERVGYGGTYVAPEGGGRIGVVPAGYHDCVPRSFSNFGYVIVAGLRCPIVGTVSMDSMSIDISRCREAHVGADVLIFGRHHDWTIPLEDVSAAIGTIPYELMARVGPRVQRIFTRH